MSSTAPASPSSSPTASAASRDPRELYLEVIHDSPEVCSNCHHRIRDHEEHDPEAATLGTGNRPTETLERAGDGILGYDADAKDAYGAIQRHHPRTYCGHCGQPGGRARDDSASKQAMLDAVQPLLHRFDDAGVPLNPDVLRYAVAELRSKESLHGKETEIWGAAVALAAKHARPRDCVRCTYRREAPSR